MPRHGSIIPDSTLSAVCGVTQALPCTCSNNELVICAAGSAGSTLGVIHGQPSARTRNEFADTAVVNAVSAGVVRARSRACCKDVLSSIPCRKIGRPAVRAACGALRLVFCLQTRSAKVDGIGALCTGGFILHARGAVPCIKKSGPVAWLGDVLVLSTGGTPSALCSVIPGSVGSQTSVQDVSANSTPRLPARPAR